MTSNKSTPKDTKTMTKPLRECLRFRILRAILFVSNLTSLILDLIILIFGKKVTDLIIPNVKDTDPTYLRIFAAIEATLCVIALFGIVLTNFFTFATYTSLLTFYLLCAIVFTRVPFLWFFFLGAILVAMAIAFSWMLYEIRRQRRQNPYNV